MIFGRLNNLPWAQKSLWGSLSQLVKANTIWRIYPLTDFWVEFTHEHSYRNKPLGFKRDLQVNFQCHPVSQSWRKFSQSWRLNYTQQGAGTGNEFTARVSSIWRESGSRRLVLFNLCSTLWKFWMVSFFLIYFPREYEGLPSLAIVLTKWHIYSQVQYHFFDCEVIFTVFRALKRLHSRFTSILGTFEQWICTTCKLRSRKQEAGKESLKRERKGGHYNNRNNNFLATLSWRKFAYLINIYP